MCFAGGIILISGLASLQATDLGGADEKTYQK